MEGKLPTAQEMRRVSQLGRGRVCLEELSLYKECVKRLQESTGHYEFTRVIHGVSTDEFQDVRIERGTDRETFRRVCAALEDAGYCISYVSGRDSGFTNHDTLRICWDEDVLAKLVEQGYR